MFLLDLWRGDVVQAWANFDFRDGLAEADVLLVVFTKFSRERASKRKVRRNRYGVFPRVVCTPELMFAWWIGISQERFFFFFSFFNLINHPTNSHKNNEQTLSCFQEITITHLTDMCSFSRPLTNLHYFTSRIRS